MSNRTSVAIPALFLVAFFIISSLVISTPVFQSSTANIFGLLKAESPEAIGSSYSNSLRATFAFVSNFETQTLEGWKAVRGALPVVVTNINYSGEPSLKSSAGEGPPQIDLASSGFVLGLSSLSFQVAILSRSATASGYFGLGSSDGKFVAVVGVNDGNIVAGKDLSNLRIVEPVIGKTSQPRGWTYLVSNVYQNRQGHWMMQVFVDSTDKVAQTIEVPDAGNYSRAVIETSHSVEYYTDIVVSSTLLTNPVPNYNNMEGYGQGGACLCSSLNVQLLPRFDNLSADMALAKWSVPQPNILSFQINSSNKTGSIIPLTCVGFFQLGVDFDPNGYIAPWYVKGNNCIPHYFAGLGGVHSPRNSNLSLSIVLNSRNNQIVFMIVDHSISRTFSSSIPYYGGAFDSMFTQLEFQPCCNSSSISDYKMQGSISNIQIAKVSGASEFLGSNYMIPWSVDAPPNWDFTYYQNSISGYDQKALD